MAADDKESDERRQSRSLRRDRGKRRRRHRSASPCPPKQRRKRSRSPGVEMKHKHKNSAEKHEGNKGQELSTRNTEGMSEEDNGTEVARKIGVEDDTEAGARNSSKEDRIVELRSIGDSSEDAYSDGESNRRRKKKKSRSKNHQSRKSKSKHRGHVRSASEEDESPTEDTSGESSEDSADEFRRAKRRKQLKPKGNAERERMEERRPKKEKVELRSIGDSSKDTYSDGESDRRRKKKKSRSKNHQSRKSKSKYRGHVRSALEEDESPTEDTSGESSKGSADESKKATRRKQLKPKEKAEPERMEDRRPNKEKVIVLKKRKIKDKEREQEKRMKKIEKVNLETLPNREEKDMLKQEVTSKALRNGMGDQTVSREDLQCHSRLRITEVCNEEKDHVVGDCFEGDNMDGNEASNDDPVLDPKHKIFLSHSGAQKEFVEHLCKALEDQMHYPFFDRCHESLPKGERFSELILEATKQCEMLIVVVSDEYFMSKWPMIELNAFVRANKLHLESKSSTNGPKILPLFYGLSVHDFKDASKRKKWIQKWKTLAKDDPKQRNKVSDWKYALEVLEKFNGIEYDAKAKKILGYEREIVSFVCESIAPNTKWDDSHVQGKSRICEVLHEKIEGVGVSQEYNVKVVGIYGVGGIGKTTICKILCNKLWVKYEGRVCHIEFQSVLQLKYEEFVHKVVRDLTWKRMEVIQQLNEGQCMEALRTSLSSHKVFLAIDNVSFNHESMEHAKKFLDVPYHKESLVIVTARSKSILEGLGIDGDACVETPELEVVEAMKLFLQHAAPGKEFTEDDDRACILKCIQSCYFSKGDGFGSHYHPLALHILGSHSRSFGKNPLEWEKNLPQVRTFGSFPRANPVFGIFKGTFDSLPFNEQRLFMDVGLCQLRNQNECCVDISDLEFFQTSIIQWLYNLHEEEEAQIDDELENLKHQGWLQEVDLDLEIVEIGMHHLHLEFVKLEAKGFFNGIGDLRMQKWLYIDDGNLTKLEKTPEGRCWTDLVHLNIVQPSLYEENQFQIARLKRIQWDHFCNVEVLHLEGLHWGGGTLNLEPLRGLRALHLSKNVKLGSLEGLETLWNLTRFTWNSDSWYFDDEDLGTRIVGSLPLSLQILFMSGGNVEFGTDFLAKCHNLSELGLGYLEANTLDLSRCWSLKTVNLIAISNLQTLSVLSDSPPLCLQSISVRDCKDLFDIPGLDHLTRLEELVIKGCIKFKLPGLPGLPEIPDLELRLGRGIVESVVVCAQNSFPRQLRTLNWKFSQLTDGLNLDGFSKLEDLDLGWNNELVSLEGVGDLPALQYLSLAGCKYLVSLEGVGDLPALRHLSLYGCEHLSQLPNLRRSRNLRILTLTKCFALKVHEKDIQMLSKLPSLELVPFGAGALGEGWSFSSCEIRLNFRQRKVLIPSCERKQGNSYCGLLRKEHKYQERDLGEPPLQIANYGPV